MRGRLLVLTLSLLVLSSSTAHASRLVQGVKTQVSAPRYVTVSVQPTPDSPQGRSQGKAQVELAYKAGFNSIRVIMPWTYPWQADVIHDAARICNVAIPAATYHMALFLNLVPQGGTPPVTSGQITRYDKTVSDYLYHLVGENGCARGLAEVNVQVPNEPNNKVFYGDQDHAAQDATHLAVRTCIFLKQQAGRSVFSAPIQCVAGELASSHDPVGFIHQMKAEASRMGIVGSFFDMFSYHCYGTGGSAFTSPDTIRTALKTDFGWSGPLLCTEYAVSNPTAQQYCQVLAMSQNSGLKGFGWFRLMDDPVGLPTGVYYYDSVLGQPGDNPIAKLPLVSQFNVAALSGSLSCG